VKVVSVKKQKKVKDDAPKTNAHKVKKNFKKQDSSKNESEEVNSADPKSSKSKQTNGKANTSQNCKYQQSHYTCVLVRSLHHSRYPYYRVVYIAGALPV